MSENTHEVGLLEQADAWIRDEYYTTDRLSIERLSGEQLLMDQGYVDLAISEPMGRRTLFSRRSPVRYEKPYKNIPIELSSILIGKRDAYDLMEKPTRVLIQGRAGVGKTTLCKKIVHQFIHHNMWGDMFDRILWVSLRTLKTMPQQRCSLEGLFLHTFFSNSPNREKLAQELENAVDSSRMSRTLFLLDGVDEVSEGFAAGNKMNTLLDFLLKQPNVIATTRPSTRLPGYLNPVYEIQITGFHPGQIKVYVENAVADSQVAGEVQSFLQQHQLMRNLVHIPIHLDALCHTWCSSEPGPEMVPETVTRLYEAVELNLWKRDVLRLSKMNKEVNEVTESSDIQSASPSLIRELVENEIAFLEGLAFYGLHNSIIDFGPEVLNNIADHIGPSLVLDNALSRLSFVRTSDAPSAETNYQFIHVTFQEYFAARYFVRRWMSGQNVEILDLEDRGTGRDARFESHNIISYLGKYKYNPRYGVFWRFVSGLLQAECDEEKLCLFFNTIENEPRDLFGPVHQRLIMHCLSEVTHQETPKFKLIQEKLEDKLRQWVLFECNYRLEWKADSRLAGEPEFPAKILTELLLEGSEHVKIKILNSIDGRPTIPAPIIEYAGAHLGENVSVCMKTAAVGVFNRPCERVPEAVFRKIVEVTKYREGDVQSEAAEALCRQTTMPDAVWQDIVELLKVPGPSVQFRAMDILSRRTNTLPESVIQSLTALLQFPKWRVRSSAARIVSRQSALSEDALHGIVDLIQDSESFARVLGSEALAEQSTLPEGIIRRLVGLLDNHEWHVQFCAMSALRRQKTLPDWVLQVLIELLDDPNDQSRASAAETIGRQPTIPEAALPRLIALVGDQEFFVRLSAVKALGRHPALPEETLQGLIALLRDPNSGVRSSVIKVLALQSKLSKSVRKSLQAVIDHPYKARSNGGRVLGGQQSIMPEAALRGLVALSRDRERHALLNAAKSFDPYSKLPAADLKGVVALLKDPNSYVRHRATRVLYFQSPLPEEVIQALIALLEHENAETRSSAALALGQEPSLPEAAVQGLTVLSQDEEGYPRCNALRALGLQRDLPEETLEKIVAMLADPVPMIRSRAAWVLRQQFTGPDDERLGRWIQTMNGRSFNTLYEWWFANSFWDHVAWCPAGFGDAGNVPLERRIRRARAYLGIPGDLL